MLESRAHPGGGMHFNKGRWASIPGPIGELLRGTTLDLAVPSVTQPVNTCRACRWMTCRQRITIPAGLSIASPGTAS